MCFVGFDATGALGCFLTGLSSCAEGRKHRFKKGEGHGGDYSGNPKSSFVERGGEDGRPENIFPDEESRIQKKTDAWVRIGPVVL